LSEEFHGSNGPKTMIGTHVAAANGKKIAVKFIYYLALQELVV
jgi:hypothetical protein